MATHTGAVESTTETLAEEQGSAELRQWILNRWEISIFTGITTEVEVGNESIELLIYVDIVNSLPAISRASRAAVLGPDLAVETRYSNRRGGDQPS